MMLLWSRFASLLLLLLFVPLLAIRAQSYDDGPVRAVLWPEHCPTPCFMGIQPGVTTVEEAVALLKSTGWLKQLNLVNSTWESLAYYALDWNGQQPAFIDEGQRDALIIWSSGESGTPDRVGAINVSLKPGITVGDVYTLLGQPTDLQVDVRPSILGRVTVYPYLEYIAHKVTFEAFASCPMDYAAFLRAPVDRIGFTIWNSEGKFTISMKNLLHNPVCR